MSSFQSHAFRSGHELGLEVAPLGISVRAVMGWVDSKLLQGQGELILFKFR